MGFKFRKSFKIAPGVKINLNKKSTGITFGGKGVHYTVNSKGQKTKSVGIPGTGLYYTETSTGNKKEKSEKTYKPSNQEKKEEKIMSTKKWYQKSWFAILMLILFFPAGVYLMWKHTNWNKIIKIVITVFFAFVLLAAFQGDEGETPSETNNNITTSDFSASSTETTENSTEESTTESTTKETTTESTTKETTTEEPTTESTTKETTTEPTTKETTTKVTTTVTTTKETTTKATTTESTTKETTTKATTAEPTTKQTTEETPNAEMVWISKTGKRYHCISNCSGMKTATLVTLDEALSRNLTPCNNCY
ncbi:MAG: DUF4236 domain-containing protein [Clostridia bacterium]|nr:DUF4236 domain-containing protein [Clostridia bacterium]